MEAYKTTEFAERISLFAHALYYLYRKFSTGAGVCDVNQSTVKEAEWLWSFLDYCYVMEKRNCSKTIEGKVKFKS